MGFSGGVWGASLGHPSLLSWASLCCEMLPPRKEPPSSGEKDVDLVLIIPVCGFQLRVFGFKIQVEDTLGGSG